MPETVGILLLDAAGFSGVAGFTLFGVEGGISAATLIGTTVLAGGLIGANALLASKPEQSSQDGQLITRQAVPPRRRNYGRVKVGGALMLSETKAGVRYQVLALSHGELDAFEELWFADGAVAWDPTTGYVTSNYITEGGDKCVILKLEKGTDSDPAFADLIATFPELWTSAHQGKGIAKALVFTIQPDVKDFTKVYPGGQPPVFRAVARAVKVWDPRQPGQNKDDKSTWTWTTNPVLIALDYHRHADGMGLAAFDSTFFTTNAMNEDWNPAANICDEGVAVNAGGTEPRYSCSGGYELRAAPKDILNFILATCDGETYARSDGAIGIRVGKTVAPSITITDTHIQSYTNFVKGAQNGLTPVNVVTGKYTAPNLDYQQTDADPWRDEDSISETGREESRNVDLNWVCSHSQARRLMKVAFHRFNPDWSVTITTDLDGLRAWGERFIRVQIEELDIDGPAEVTSFEITSSGSCNIGLRSFNQLAYDWDPEHEEGTAPNTAEPSDEDAIADPDNLDASVASTEDGNIIYATWDDSGRIDTTPQLQYRVNPAGPWLDGIVDDGTHGHVAGLATGHYDIQVRFVVGSLSSGWSPLLDISV